MTARLREAGGPTALVADVSPEGGGFVPAPDDSIPRVDQVPLQE